MSSVLQTKLDAVREEILELIDGVADAGPVYDWLRNINHQETLQAITKDTEGRLQFWQFGLAADTPLSLRRIAAGETRVTALWDVHGYMAVQDLATPPTEKTFDGIVADVIYAFEADKKLNGTAIEAGPAQREQGGHIAFGSVLCHYARLRVQVLFGMDC